MDQLDLEGCKDSRVSEGSLGQWDHQDSQDSWVSTEMVVLRALLENQVRQES